MSFIVQGAIKRAPLSIIAPLYEQTPWIYRQGHQDTISEKYPLHHHDSRPLNVRSGHGVCGGYHGSCRFSHSNNTNAAAHYPHPFRAVFSVPRHCREIWCPYRRQSPYADMCGITWRVSPCGRHNIVLHTVGTRVATGTRTINANSGTIPTSLTPARRSALGRRRWHYRFSSLRGKKQRKMMQGNDNAALDELQIKTYQEETCLE